MHVEAFRTHEIDGKALLLLSTTMLMKYLGLKLGPALKICNIIDKLKVGLQYHPKSHFTFSGQKAPSDWMRPCKLWHLFDIYVMQAFTIVQQCTEYRFYIRDQNFQELIKEIHRSGYIN